MICCRSSTTFLLCHVYAQFSFRICATYAPYVRSRWFTRRYSTPFCSLCLRVIPPYAALFAPFLLIQLTFWRFCYHHHAAHARTFAPTVVCPHFYPVSLRIPVFTPLLLQHFAAFVTLLLRRILFFWFHAVTFSTLRSFAFTYRACLYTLLHTWRFVLRFAFLFIFIFYLLLLCTFVVPWLPVYVLYPPLCIHAFTLPFYHVLFPVVGYYLVLLLDAIIHLFYFYVLTFVRSLALVCLYHPRVVTYCSRFGSLHTLPPPLRYLPTFLWLFPPQFLYLVPLRFPRYFPQFTATFVVTTLCYLRCYWFAVYRLNSLRSFNTTIFAVLITPFRYFVLYRSYRTLLPFFFVRWLRCYSCPLNYLLPYSSFFFTIAIYLLPFIYWFLHCSSLFVLPPIVVVVVLYLFVEFHAVEFILLLLFITYVRWICLPFVLYFTLLLPRCCCVTVVAVRYLVGPFIYVVVVTLPFTRCYHITVVVAVALFPIFVHTPPCGYLIPPVLLLLYCSFYITFGSVVRFCLYAFVTCLYLVFYPFRCSSLIVIVRSATVLTVDCIIIIYFPFPVLPTVVVYCVLLPFVVRSLRLYVTFYTAHALPCGCLLPLPLLLLLPLYLTTYRSLLDPPCCVVRCSVLLFLRLRCCYCRLTPCYRRIYVLVGLLLYPQLPAFTRTHVCCVCPLIWLFIMPLYLCLTLRYCR